MNTLEEKILVAHICSHLDRSIEHLDAKTVSTLDSARQKALGQHSGADENTDNTLFVDSVLSTLEDHELLSPDISHRLDAMRRQAVQRVSASSKTESFSTRVQNWLEQLLQNNFSVTAGMVATACLTVTVVTLFYANPESGLDLSLDEELVLVASAEDLELYENLDFYLWLDENGLTN